MGDMSKAAERRKAPLQTPSIFDTNAIRDLSGALNLARPYFGYAGITIIDTTAKTMKIR